MRLIRKGILVLRSRGPQALFQAVMKKLKGTLLRNSDIILLRRLLHLSDEEKARQRNFKFDRDIKFSILVPLYKTPKKVLTFMINSVTGQTYSNWELCLADGSGAGYDYISDICNSLAKEHPGKILYKKLEKNLGIADNTNACIGMSTGNYFALLDHDDALHPAALFENMKAICGQSADFIYSDECKFQNNLKDLYDTFFKPDFSPDTLRGCNYICHLTVFSRALLDKIGEGFRRKYDGSQDYDLVLRLTEAAEHIYHIPKILYFWRTSSNSVAADVGAKPYAYNAAIKVLNKHLGRVGLKGEALHTFSRGFYQMRYELPRRPLISIIIPNMDHVNELSKCLQSIFEETTYENYEILIIENNSKEPETFEYYKTLESNEKIKLHTWEGSFNFSAINNFGVSKASGEYVVLLNNDTEIITDTWLEEMLMFAQRGDVGAVGAMLYYPDDTVQHAGAVLGFGGVAGHTHYLYERGNIGYFGGLIIARNVSCVTAACIMLPRNVYNEVGGMNEDLAVAFNDMDLCMRVRKAGYLIVWTPFCELYHHESQSRGYEDTPEKLRRFDREVELFQKIWAKELEAGDPYYNENLSLERADFHLKDIKKSDKRLSSLRSVCAGDAHQSPAASVGVKFSDK